MGDMQSVKWSSLCTREGWLRGLKGQELHQNTLANLGRKMRTLMRADEEVSPGAAAGKRNGE